jgi:predicted thioesterase
MGDKGDYPFFDPWVMILPGKMCQEEEDEMYSGLMGKSEMIVRESDLVSRLGGVAVDVLSTPRLIQLMEAAAIEAVREFLQPGQMSLGTLVKIRHLSATPLGMKVTAHAILKEVDQKRLLFWIDAHDEIEKVAEGEHERVLVSRERFLERIEKKKNRSPTP